VFGLLTIGQAVTGKGRDDIAVHQQIDGTHLRDLPRHVIRPETVDVTSKLTDASRRDKWLVAGRDLLPILLTLAFAFLARWVLLSVRDGDPFTERNVARLRGIGFLCLVGLPVLSIATSMFNSALASSLGNDLSTSTDISFTGPFISIGVFALAELFAQGVRLRQDVEGTV
jgi:hypothetical protein